MSFEPNLQEGLVSIQQFSSGKAPREDAILPEIYKYGCKMLVKK